MREGRRCDSGPCVVGFDRCHVSFYKLLFSPLSLLRSPRHLHKPLLAAAAAALAVVTRRVARVLEGVSQSRHHRNGFLARLWPVLVKDAKSRDEILGVIASQRRVVNPRRMRMTRPSFNSSWPCMLRSRILFDNKAICSMSGQAAGHV